MQLVILDCQSHLRVPLARSNSDGSRGRARQVVRPGSADPEARGRQRPELHAAREPATAGEVGTVVRSLLLSVGEFCR